MCGHTVKIENLLMIYFLDEVGQEMKELFLRLNELWKLNLIYK